MARLKRLAEAGYLQRHFLPRPQRTGSAPLVYALASRGRRLLRALGQPVQRRYRPAEVRELAYLHLAHTLALNDLLIALELLTREVPELQIAELRHERDLKRAPVEVTLPDGARRGVVPDAWVDLRIATRYQACYAIELDRGTAAAADWRRKVAALARYADGPYQQAFGTSSLTVAVVATPGTERSARLRRWTEAELVAIGREDAAGLFRFSGGQVTDQEPEQLFLSPCWHVPFLEGRQPLVDFSWISSLSEKKDMAAMSVTSEIADRRETSVLPRSGVVLEVREG